MKMDGVDALRRVLDRRVPWAVHDEAFSHQSFGTGPALTQGWKLHLSATPFSALEVLMAALDVLLPEGARFKVVRSIELLRSLNAGHFGLSQIGKFITIYPSDNASAVRLAVNLDEATRGHRGPRVPTDRPLNPRSLVHYRYGGMHERPDWNSAGRPNGNYTLQDAAGRLTNDVRVHYYVPPAAGIDDPFEAANVYVARPARDTLLNGRYLVLNACSHGPRGGVFRAVDIKATTPRLCLLKEAWHDVSLDSIGRDARDWLANEERILSRRDYDPLMPRFYDRFDLEDDRFIAIEYIEGMTLDQALADRHGSRERITASEIETIGLATAAALAHFHEGGLVFRDFQPSNVIETPSGDYRLIDFGIAYDSANTDEVPIGGGTPPFYSRAQFEGETPTPSDDVFAWGAIMHYLACGTSSLAAMPKDDFGLRPFARRPVVELRRNFPPAVAAVIDRAVAWDVADRYSTMIEGREALLAAVRETRAAQATAPREVVMTLPDEGPPEIAMETMEALSLACQIGDALCGSAEERDGGLCWGARNELSEGVEHSPDLYSGAAGIGLFLAELAKTSGNSRYADTARGAARWLAAPTWGGGRAQHGLYGGEPGVSYFFLRLAELLEEPGYITAAEMRMRRLKGAIPSTIDLFYGTAGTIVALMRLYRATGDSSYLKEARLAGDELIQRAIPAPRGGAGCYWDVPPATPPGANAPLLGLLHGAAGIGLALAQLTEETGEEKYCRVTSNVAELLLSQARPLFQEDFENGASEGRRLAWPRRLGDDSPGLQAVCHGAGGIAQFLVRLNSLTPDRRYKKAAEGAARTVFAQLRHETHSCLCHGLSGTGYVLLDCYQAYSEQSWLDLARDCGARLQVFRDPNQTGAYTTSLGGVASADLMLGYAGIGSLFLRLANPEASADLILGSMARD